MLFVRIVVFATVGVVLLTGQNALSPNNLCQCMPHRFQAIVTNLQATNAENIPQGRKLWLLAYCSTGFFFTSHWTSPASPTTAEEQTGGTEWALFQEMHVFFSAKRFAVKIYSHNVTSGESTFVQRVVTDFDKGKQYLFPASNASECIVKNASLIQPPQCLTSSRAKYIGSSVVGSPYFPLLVDTWRFSLGSNTTERELTVGFADHSISLHRAPVCVPVFQSVASATDPDNGHVMLFSDFRPQINIRLFDVRKCLS